nr:hypothetical protein [Tanacetum cinerariifolium]
MNDKMKDPECVTHKVKIAPHDYSKENFLATFTPQKQLTPEEIFWSQDLIKMKSKALKEQTTVSRPIKALMVYSPNTPAMLVPRYVKDNMVLVVHSNVSSVPNDAYMMIYNDMYESHAQSVSKTSRNIVVENSLTAELATYKEQVKLYKRRARFKLTESEQKINEQLRLVISDRNYKEETSKKELHSVKLKLASTINHNKLMVEEVSLSNPYSKLNISLRPILGVLQSPPLPSPLHIPPPVDRRDDIPETEMPPRKRLCLSTLGSRYKVEESFTARPTKGRGIDYGFVSTLDAKARRQGIREVGYGIRDTWVDPTETVLEIAPMIVRGVNTRVIELAEIHDHDTHDLYALLEDAQDSKTHISQRVAVDSQRKMRIEQYFLVTDYSLWEVILNGDSPFWNTAVVKRSGNVTRLQALVDKKRIVITEEVVREILQLNDAEGVICLTNEDTFAGLARMGYEKPVGKGFLGVETPLFETMLAVRDVAEDAEAQQVLDTCSALVLRVEGLENANTAQQHEIVKLKARVKKLEKINKVKSSKLRRLKKVGTSQHVESLDDVENVFNQGRNIVDMNQDEGIELVADQAQDAEVEGRHADKQAEIYNIDLDHSSKVLSMQEDDTEVQEAVEVVTTVKLITEVVTAAATHVAAASTPIPAVKPKTLTITAALIVSTRRRKGVVIRDPEEELPSDTPAETPKVKDKGKGILIEAPKPLKKKDQIEMDVEYAKKLQEEMDKEHEEAYKNIDWNAALDHVQSKEPQFDANMKFLFKSREEIEKEDEEIIKSINETPAQKAAKRRKLREEAQEAGDLRKRLEIVQDEDDDVFVEATPLAQKVPVVDYQVVVIDNKPKYPLSRFTLKQLVNVARLQVEEESEMSLELLRVDAARYSIYTVKRYIANVAASFQRSQIHIIKLSMSYHCLGRLVFGFGVWIVEYSCSKDNTVSFGY